MYTRDYVRVQAHAQERASTLTHATRRCKCACVRVLSACPNGYTRHANAHVQTTRNLQMRMHVRVFSACRRAPGAAARADANGSETTNAHACARFARARGHRKKRRCAHVGAICARPQRRYHRATVPQYPSATVPRGRGARRGVNSRKKHCSKHHALCVKIHTKVQFFFPT